MAASIFIESEDPKQARQDTQTEEGEENLAGSEGSSLIRHNPSDSEHSDTSTLKYSQEPWAEFSERVQRLCKILWPPKRTAKSRLANSKFAAFLRRNSILRALIPSQQIALIERLQGGDYNRIIGITPPASGDQLSHRLVLRVPRELDFRPPDHDVEMLKYVRDHSSIPVATIAGYDFTRNNPLGSPYVIQHRIPGQNLEKLWSQLTHPQRRIIAKDLGRVVQDLMALEAPANGVLEASADNAELYTIKPFPLKDSCGEIVEEPEPSMPSDPTSAQGRQTIIDFFNTQFHRWRAVDLDSNCGAPDHVVDKWDKMLTIIQEMESLQLFKPDLNCLCHTDLYPRNIMVGVQADSAPKITAILDWDEAVFAPKFIACKPPVWLWDPNSEDRLDEEGSDPWPCELPGADDQPASEENAELKRLFEIHAGPEYRELAYAPQYRLCRGLFRMAMVGLTSSENFRAADRVASEWEALRSAYV